jgi:nucleoside phosphorylase
MHDLSVSAANQDEPTEYEDLGGPMAPEVEKLVKDLPGWAHTLDDWSDAKSVVRPRPAAVIPASEKADSLYGPAAWKKKVIRGLKANFPPDVPPRRPIALPATFITSNTLIKDADLAKRWLINARQSMAAEMELAGVMAAARSVGDAETCVLAIRGISDIVGYKREPEWTEFACHSAAAFTHALIVSGMIRR